MLTGASGLLGTALARRLSPHAEVHALVRTAPRVRPEGITYHVVDFCGEWQLPSSLTSFDTVIHLAQSSRFREFPDGALDVFRVNVDSTARLLDYAKRVKAGQFIYASSGGVYGTGAGAFHENSPLVAPSKLGYYLGSKLCGEVLAQSYVSIMQVVVLRFFFMYGPGQNRGMLIPRLVDNIREGRPVSLQGSDGIRVNPIYVDDAVAAVVAAMNTTESATYNVAGSEVFSIRGIAYTIGKVLGVEARFERADGEPHDLVGSNELMDQRLHEPTVSFADGVRSLL